MSIVRCAVFTAVILLIPGCLEHNITTTINEDGSCERLIMLPADSLLIPETPFPLPPCAGWDTTWRPAPQGGGLVFTMRRRFASFEELMSACSGGGGEERLRVTLEIRKKFRWFYTYVLYREVYHHLSQFTLVAPSSVLSDDEIARYTAGERSDSLNSRVEEWMARNLYERLHRDLSACAAQLGDSTLTSGSIESHKEELFRGMFRTTPDGRFRELADVLAEQTSWRGKESRLFSGDRLTEDGLSAFLELLAAVERSDAVWTLRDPMRTAWATWNDAVKRSARLQGVFVNVVSLPGLLVDASSSIIEGNTVTWRFDGEQYGLADYVMTAESRLENFWAFFVTGAAALLVIAAILTGGRRRRAGDSA